MNNLIIFLSKNESFIGSAEKISKKALVNTQIVYMEDFIVHKNLYNIDETDVMYFLTNEKLILQVIDILEKTSCYIYNKEFLKKGYNKDEVQKILKNNNINVPEILSIDEIKKDCFPLFCKQKQHTGITFQAYNEFTLKSFFKKFNKEDFYLEKTIMNKDDIAIEDKIYYINGNVYLKDGQELLDKELITISLQISKALNNLELFSADFIKTSDNYNIIDINPASGFYLCEKGAKQWLENIKKQKNSFFVLT